jgi:hypothetical protein
MAKKNRSKASSPKPKTEKRSRTRRVYERAKSASRKSGMRWGEVALAALVGYEGDKILDGVGLGTMAYPYMAKIAPLNDAIQYQATQRVGTYGELSDVVINKTAGLAALLKSAYDVVKHKKLNDQDKNILIPYAIGTVFDGPKKESSSSGGWH